jgi:periplasmic divalent cation tolerance protein
VADATIGVVITTVSSAAEGETLAAQLVGERAAACVTALPGARSLYRWKGEVEHAEEIVLLVKTRSECVEHVAERIRALHAYETPEILCCPGVRASEAYAAWVAEEVDECPADRS